MAFRKLDGFDSNEVALAGFARAMAHPARIRIVALLIENENDMSCGDLVSQLPLAQSTTSQHLKELVKAGILEVESIGSICRYHLDRSQLLHFCKNFQIAMGNDPKNLS